MDLRSAVLIVLYIKLTMFTPAAKVFVEWRVMAKLRVKTLMRSDGVRGSNLTSKSRVCASMCGRQSAGKSCSMRLRL
jgi:hypothetical protein